MKRIALIGSFPPRQCGIATFTNDLNNSLIANNIRTSIVAVNDGLRNYDYPSAVAFEINQNEISTYIKAANFLNTGDYDAVILQHEFGIFGGKDGSHVIQLLKRLRLPVVTTLHTILDNPTKGQKEVFRQLGKLSKKLISISAKGIEMLQDIYHIPASKCAHIHHGIHKINVSQSEKTKEKLGVQNKTVILTFGLLSKTKSIEVIIKALPKVIESHPDIVYVVVGATHPHVLKREGEAYRHSLIRLVNKLKLKKHVIFIDRFVSNKELFELLKMSDIYVIPYAGEKQISSGTLIYTMGAGKPIISTPFWYAQEMLADNRGILVDFNDTEQFSEKITFLLDHQTERKKIGKNALEFTKQCLWSNIGNLYIKLLKKLPKPSLPDVSIQEITDDVESIFTLPTINLHQLRVLTDYTGILQHARYNIPDRAHGYCIDDNARALLLSVMLQNEVQDIDELHRLTSVYLSFIDYAFNHSNGKFRNFMSYERQWLDGGGTEDSNGRTLWALGYAAANTLNNNFYHHAHYLFHHGLKNIENIVHPRSLAYLILGLVSYLEIHPEENIIEVLQQKTEQLSSFFDHSIDKKWLWHNDMVTYANSRIPQALIASGVFLNKEHIKSKGLKILDWLIMKQFQHDVFSPIGNKGWLTQDGKANYDQQPLEAHGMIDACLQAEELTKDQKYGDYALKAFAWFTGENDQAAVLYDFTTGGCRDGLQTDGPNLNQGAESTLSWLMSLLSISFYLRDKNK